jgi:peptidyl-prolyl cis-trans isomerase A (cyclophilin A)
MKPLICLCLLLLATISLAQESSGPSTPADAVPPPVETPKPVTVKVRMQTALGDIVLDIETERAPITAANFLRYVDGKRMDGMGFYRAMKLDEAGNYGMVQTGIRDDVRKLFKPIEHEPTTLTGLSHVDGAISMARTTPGTATSDFFIIVGNLTSLDAQPTAPGDNLGYAVFGHVVEGVEIVKAIMEQPLTHCGRRCDERTDAGKPVKVLTVRRVE